MAYVNVWLFFFSDSCWYVGCGRRCAWIFGHEACIQVCEYVCDVYKCTMLCVYYTQNCISGIPFHSFSLCFLYVCSWFANKSNKRVVLAPEAQSRKWLRRLCDICQIQEYEVAIQCNSDLFVEMLYVFRIHYSFRKYIIEKSIFYLIKKYVPIS